MVKTFRFDTFRLSLNRHGSSRYVRGSFPIRYGRFHEIKSGPCTFQVDLNGHIKYIGSRDPAWPDPAEWLKRTQGNDWVYYAAGGYDRYPRVLGEHYFPCLSYPTNTVLRRNPFARPAVRRSHQAWFSLVQEVGQLPDRDIPQEAAQVLHQISSGTHPALAGRARALHRILGSRVRVLPPDARHVDYDVIPLRISEGCSYNCSFCRVKSGRPFRLCTIARVRRQIKALRDFFGPELHNCGSVFLGQHDALQAPGDHILESAGLAWDGFALDRSNLQDHLLFLFGSVDSLLQADDHLFSSLDRLPWRTCINIGLESFDQATLDLLGKPIAAEAVRAAFTRMLAINCHCASVEITANIVLSTQLPDSHHTTLQDVCERLGPAESAACRLYCSPLEDFSEPGSFFSAHAALQQRVPVPLYLYIIQRL